jgi:hypothetical protein
MWELVSEKPTRGMLVKHPLYGDVSEKPMMEMIYPFSAGTLTFVRTIETFIKIFCHLINKLNKANLKEVSFAIQTRGKPSRPPSAEFQQPANSAYVCV